MQPKFLSTLIDHEIQLKFWLLTNKNAGLIIFQQTRQYMLGVCPNILLMSHLKSVRPEINKIVTIVIKLVILVEMLSFVNYQSVAY